jgi:hypothetical protein
VSIDIAQGSQPICDSGGARKLRDVAHIVIGDAAQPASPSEVQLSVGIDLAAQNKRGGGRSGRCAERAIPESVRPERPPRARSRGLREA